MHARLATIAALCREAALPASVLVWLVAFGPTGIDSTGAISIVTPVQPVVATETRLTVQPPAIAFGAADVAAASRSVTEQSIETPAPHEPDPIVAAALTGSSEMLPAEAPPKQADEGSVASREPDDTNRDVGSTEITDECSTADACIDRYLWDLYHRAPKEDAIRTEQRRKVTVKRKGRSVTVTRTFTTLSDEDFSWKDPKAAEKAGMPMADYVIGGIDRDFKLRLFRMLRAAEKAGLSPGITSGFRDDYRQSIASGLKAADNRSYHGGSLRGGYGHGLAADIVGVNGATRAERLVSSNILWKWVDDHGKEFGIGRPYLDRDPPHVAPIDGKEYADHHPGMKARQEKPHGVLASREHHSPAKHSRTAS
jgi:hypothetical protein